MLYIGAHLSQSHSSEAAVAVDRQAGRQVALTNLLICKLQVCLQLIEYFGPPR